MPPSATRLADAIQEWLDIQKADGKSIKTTSSRASTMRRFLQTVGDIYPRSLTVTHIDKYVQAHAHWTDSTRKQNLMVLSAFQSWCRDRGLMDRNTDILSGRRKVSVARRARTRIPGDQIDYVIESTEDPRDQMLLALGLHLLTRSSEMVPIKWKHVDLEEDEIGVWRFKTKEYDYLPMSVELRDVILRWKRHVCKHMGVFEPDREWYLVCRYVSGGELGPNGKFKPGQRQLAPTTPLRNPGSVVKPLLATYGYGVKGEVMHMLRRSGARALLDSLAEDGARDTATRIVKEQLGHKYLVTTESYTGSEYDRHRRNQAIKGRRLYPGGGASANVVPLRKVE